MCRVLVKSGPIGDALKIAPAPTEKPVDDSLKFRVFFGPLALDKPVRIVMKTEAVEAVFFSVTTETDRRSRFKPKTIFLLFGFHPSSGRSHSALRSWSLIRPRINGTEVRAEVPSKIRSFWRISTVSISSSDARTSGDSLLSSISAAASLKFGRSISSDVSSPKHTASKNAFGFLCRRFFVLFVNSWPIIQTS